MVCLCFQDLRGCADTGLLERPELHLVMEVLLAVSEVAQMLFEVSLSFGDLDVVGRRCYRSVLDHWCLVSSLAVVELVDLGKHLIFGLLVNQ